MLLGDYIHISTVPTLQVRGPFKPLLKMAPELWECSLVSGFQMPRPPGHEAVRAMLKFANLVFHNQFKIMLA